MTTKMHTITAQELSASYNANDMIIIDVREHDEVISQPYTGLNILHIPMNDIPARINELNKDRRLIIACRSGKRSQMVCDFLNDNGFENTENLTGGVLAWNALKDKQ